MLNSYLKIALRSLLHYRFLSVLNVLGLAVGMSTAMLLILFVGLELSYDRFHRDRDRIFRITSRVQSRDGQVMVLPTCLGWTPESIYKAGFTDVIACRVYDEQIGRQRNRPGDQMRIFYVDSTFFRVFSFKLLEGDPADILNKPYQVVLTRSLALRYFGTEDAINREFEINNRYYRVAGVMEDVPVNSHLQFDLLISFESLKYRLDIRRMSMDFALYMKLPTDFNEKYVSKLTAYVEKIHREHYPEIGPSLRFGLQKLTDIHLRSSGFTTNLGQTGNVKDLVILFSLALFIFLFTLANFINLLTANNNLRIRNIGMRIVLGARRQQLRNQLITESVLIGGVASFVAIVLLELGQRPFSVVVGKTLPLSFAGMTGIFMIFLSLAVLAGFLTGWIHFLSLTHHPPVRMISGLHVPLGRDRLKIILVIVQFATVIFLFSVMSVLVFQTRYMKQGDPGFERENLYVFYEPFSLIWNDFPPIGEDISSVPGVISVTASAGIPGEIPAIQNVWVDGDNMENAILISEDRVRQNFPETFRFHLVGGKFFEGGSRSDTGGFILNQSACQALGLSEPVGSVIHVWDHRDTVIGVVKDFHFKSWHNRIEPLVISRYFRPYRYITVRAESDTIKGTLVEVRDLLGRYLPTHYLTVYPLAKLYDTMYSNEDKNAMLFFCGALLAMIMGIFGLIGLTTYTTLRKTKEIGIRKAMGSSRANLFFILGGSIVRWMLLSALIAMPLAWLAVHDWMNRFFYKIGYAWALILCSVLLAIAIAFLTTSHHILRISRKNPVDSLRYE
jgi:putative ABC transport system permease protein